MLDRLKKIGLSLSVIALFLIYGLQKEPDPENDSIAADPVIRAATPAPARPAAQAATSPTAPVQPAYVDGVYTGSKAKGSWGDVLVQVRIQNGRIVDVQVPIYPNHRDQSEVINKSAIPELRTEVLAAQSAEIDIVTAATDTSKSFIESLESALAKARA